MLRGEMIEDATADIAALADVQHLAPHRTGGVGQFRDDSGVIDLVWFTGIHWLEKALVVGTEYVAYGRINAYGNMLSIPHPEMEVATPENLERAPVFAPVYPGTEKLNARNLDAKALRRLVRDYTREAGVRNMERTIGTICRKVATKVAENGSTEPIVITPDNLVDFLKKPKFFDEVAERTEIPGVATGLAWTMTGGDILFLEATRMPGKKGFTITGQLGDVMKESIQAANAYVRAHAPEFGIHPSLFEKRDIHVHVPEGATPKDGPSAGIGMCTAIVSVLTGIAVRADVAMTGEITLRGQVLAIGGLKEKLLAAHRGGIKTVVIPEENERDLKEIPENIKSALEIRPVRWIDQVLDIALERMPDPVSDEEWKRLSEKAAAEIERGVDESRINTH